MFAQIKKQLTGIIFLGIILVFWVGLAYPELNLDFQVPGPPQGELLDSKALRLGGRDIRTFLYNSKENQYDIAAYYQRFFEGQEFWNILDKAKQHNGSRILRFKKQDLVVSISIMPDIDETQVVIAKYLQPEGSLSPEETKPSVKDSLFALPEQDKPGEDLMVIPRPPESIRWMSKKLDRGQFLIYATALPVAETVRFYKAQMPYRAWRLQEETATSNTLETYKQITGRKDLGVQTPFSDGEDLNQIVNDSYILNFRGSFGEAQITVFPNFVDRQLGSIVQINYNKDIR